MLPLNSSGSFKRYRNETDYFITWLAQTAIGCGVKFTTTSQSLVAIPTVAKAPRLKGKARKTAREEAAAARPQGPPKATKGLTTAELLECAKRIVERKASSSFVPRTIYDSLLKAIELRVECTSWFHEQKQTSSDGDLQRSNVTHGFFNAPL